jgi:hypothetical protein
MFPTLRIKLNKFIGVSIMYFGISYDQLTPNIIPHIVEFEYNSSKLDNKDIDQKTKYPLSMIQSNINIPQKINP